MNTTRSRIALAEALATGAGSWLLVAQVADRREASDSELYFIVALPALGLLAALLAFLEPDRPWRWAFATLAGQTAAAFILNPTAGLLPMGLIVFAFFGALCLVPAVMGAWLGRRSRRAHHPPP